MSTIKLGIRMIAHVNNRREACLVSEWDADNFGTCGSAAELHAYFWAQIVPVEVSAAVSEHRFER